MSVQTFGNEGRTKLLTYRIERLTLLAKKPRPRLLRDRDSSNVMGRRCGVSGLSNSTVCAALTLSPVQCLPVMLPVARCRYREIANSLISHYLIELGVWSVTLGHLANSPSSIRRIIDGTSTSRTSIGAVTHVLTMRHFVRVSTLTRRSPFTFLLDERLVSSTRRLSVQ
jgi:hypothetical protein